MATVVGKIPSDRLNGTSQHTPVPKKEKSFGGFLRTLRDTGSSKPGIKQKAIETLEKDYGTVYKTAMGETPGDVGGYLVPFDFSLQLMNTLDQESIIYSRANVVPMHSATTRCPTVNTTTAQSAGTPPFFGGMLFTWGFQEVPTETEPTFSQVDLTAWDLIGIAKISNMMLDDMGPDGEATLVNVFGKAAAWFTEYAFFSGTGAATNMPQGILGAAGAKTVTRTGSNTVANTYNSRRSR